MTAQYLHAHLHWYISAWFRILLDSNELEGDLPYFHLKRYFRNYLPGIRAAAAQAPPLRHWREWPDDALWGAWYEFTRAIIQLMPAAV